MLLDAAPTYAEWDLLRGKWTTEGNDWKKIADAPDYTSRDLGNTYGNQGSDSRDN
jgi:hypothetical protein